MPGGGKGGSSSTVNVTNGPITVDSDSTVAVSGLDKIGLTAKIEIRHEETVSAVVPVGALVDGHGDSASVFVIDGDHARKTPVRVAFLQDDRAALLSGLESTAAVVESGAAQLEDGSRVRLVP